MMTRAHLANILRQFYHPSLQKLFNLLKKALPELATPEILRILEEIATFCGPCQRIRPGPVHFRKCARQRAHHDGYHEHRGKGCAAHRRRDYSFFGRSFSPIHLYEDDMGEILALLGDGKHGFPQPYTDGSGSQQGKGEPFISLCAQHNVKTEATGTEAHSSLGIGERYHEPLRTLFPAIDTAHSFSSDIHRCRRRSPAQFT